MIMRSILAVSMVVVTGTAQASFDLMLLGDNTTAGSQRVVRYDPINRVVLGSFGTGFLNENVADIDVDPATGRAFVLQSGGGVRVFNYNTGELLAAFTTNSFYGDIAFDSATDTVILANGFGSNTAPPRAYNTSNGTIATTFAFRLTATAPLRRSGSTWYGAFAESATGTTANAVRYSTSGSVLSGEVTGLSTAPGNFPRHSIFASDGRMMGIASRSGDNTTTLWSIPSNISGFTVTTITVSASIAPYFSNSNIVNGHGQLVYLLNGSSLISYHTGVNAVLGSQSLGFASATNIRGMAIVLAPEPGTLVALGLGAAALLRRRRRTEK